MSNFKGDKILTAIKIVLTIFIALLVAAACVGLVIMFYRIDYLPFWVTFTVQLLCLVMAFADVKLALSYLKGLLEDN